MRVAHVGNIAQNAYLDAKFQRRCGVEADSFDLGGGNAMWLPWWEDAAFEPAQLHPSHYDWVTVARATGVPRPPWAKILGPHGDPAWYDTQEEYQADFCRFIASVTHGPVGESLDDHDAAAREALSHSRLTDAEQAACVRGLRDVPYWRSLLEIAKHYDLLVLYGPYAGAAVVLPCDVKYLTFEHSTMRMVPLRDTPDRLLLAAAYRHADHNILTNADCREAAWALNLDPARLSFIPHPLDTDAFCPAPAPSPSPATMSGTLDAAPPDATAALEDTDEADAASVRANLLETVPGGAALLFFAPARQSNNAETGAKRNDRFFHAFARYVADAEPAGAPRAALLAGQWGNAPDVAQSKALVRSLGIGRRVLWLNAQPKHRMRLLYRAADVVLDQFDGANGSFGTVTGEALSSGRPVITHISAAAHAWCAERMTMPPIAPALTSPEIYDWLVRLATLPALRATLGAESRAWVLREHSWQRVTQDHLALYATVLGVSVGALTGTDVPADAAEAQEERGEPADSIGHLALTAATATAMATAMATGG